MEENPYESPQELSEKRTDEVQETLWLLNWPNVLGIGIILASAAALAFGIWADT